MGILSKIGKKIDQKIDYLSMCPACKHKTDTGISGCTCKRTDCMCTHRNKERRNGR